MLDAVLEWLSGLLNLGTRFWSHSAAVISILVLATLIYKGYKALEASGSLELLRGVFSIGLLYLVSYVLRLEFLIWLLDRVIPTLLILMAIILQPELRRIFVQIGRQIHVRHRQYLDVQAIEDTLRACEQLSDMGRGALIIFRREDLLRHISRTGIMLNARVSAELLVSIFAYDTPLHDGATVLADSKLIAGGCILPIDPEDSLASEAMEAGAMSLMGTGLGTRHRSALELARGTDAVVLVVSEETGNVSLVYDGHMRAQMSSEEITEKLHELLIDESDTAKQNRFWLWVQKVLLGRNLAASPKNTKKAGKAGKASKAGRKAATPKKGPEISKPGKASEVALPKNDQGSHKEPNQGSNKELKELAK